jgi:hypothetical protein
VISEHLRDARTPHTTTQHHQALLRAHSAASGLGDPGLVPFNTVDLERQPGDVEAAEQDENAKHGEHDGSSAEDREHRKDRRIKDERAHADSPNEAKLLSVRCALGGRRPLELAPSQECPEHRRTGASR